MIWASASRGTMISTSWPSETATTPPEWPPMRETSARSMILVGFSNVVAPASFDFVATHTSTSAPTRTTSAWPRSRVTETVRTSTLEAAPSALRGTSSPALMARCTTPSGVASAAR